MHDPFYYTPFPQSEEEYRRQDEQLARAEKFWLEQLENNGEFRDVETGCTPAEMYEAPKPARSADQPMQMNLFNEQEVA